MSELYIRQSGKVFGPFSASQIEKAMKTGKIARDAMYKEAGTSSWHPVKDLLKASSSAEFPPLESPAMLQQGGGYQDELSEWIQHTNNLPAIQKEEKPRDSSPAITFDGTNFKKLLDSGLIGVAIVAAVGVISTIVVRSTYPRLANAIFITVAMISVAHLGFLAMRMLADFPLPCFGIGIGVMLCNGTPVFLWIINRLVEAGSITGDGHVPEIIFWFVGLFHLLIAFHIISKYVLNEEITLVFCTTAYVATEFIMVMITCVMTFKTTQVVSNWLAVPYDVIYPG